MSCGIMILGQISPYDTGLEILHDANRDTLRFIFSSSMQEAYSLYSSGSFSAVIG